MGEVSWYKFFMKNIFPPFIISFPALHFFLTHLLKLLSLCTFSQAGTQQNIYWLLLSHFVVEKNLFSDWHFHMPCNKTASMRRQVNETDQSSRKGRWTAAIFSSKKKHLPQKSPQFFPFLSLCFWSILTLSRISFPHPETEYSPLHQCWMKKRYLNHLFTILDTYIHGKNSCFFFI